MCQYQIEKEKEKKKEVNTEDAGEEETCFQTSVIEAAIKSGIYEKKISKIRLSHLKSCSQKPGGALLLDLQ